MTTLTKGEVRKLTVEQQAAVAQLELKLIVSKQRLAQMARGYRGMHLIGGTLMGVAMAIGMYSSIDPRALQFAIIATVFLVGVQAGGLNRRIDALLQLFEIDQARKAGAKPANDVAETA